MLGNFLLLSQRTSFGAAVILILSFFAFHHSVNAQATYGNTAPIIINDAVPATPYPSAINVSEVFGITRKVTVKLKNFSHTYPSDVDILLVSPDGKTALIMSDTGGSIGVNGVDITFDDNAADSIPTPIVTGTYKPTNNDNNTDNFPLPAPSNSGNSALSVFNGINPNGFWTLYVRDDVNQDAGAITGGWEITIYAANQFENITPITFSSGSGTSNPYPSSLTVAGVTGRIVKTQVRINNINHTAPGDIDLLLVAPNGRSIILMSDAGGFNPANNLTVTFNDDALGFLPYEIPIDPGTYKPTNYELTELFPFPAPQPTGTTLATFNGIDPNGTWSLFAVDDTDGNAGAITGGWTITFEVSPTALTIQQAGTADPYPSQITIAGMSGTVTKVVASITNFSHSFPDDVDILLIAPNGRSVVLMSDVGGGTEVSNINLTLDDSAANSLPDNSQLQTGTYKPTNIDTSDTFPSPAPAAPFTGTTLSAFNGSTPNGVWKLFVVDDNGNNAGSIGGWSLSVQSSLTACNFTTSSSGQAFSLAGGSGSFNVSIPFGCTWNASVNSNFVSFTSPVTGNGSGTISFNVAPNPGTARTATITVTNGIMSRTFLIQQESACPLSISQSSFNFSDTGGNGNVNVVANQQCSWLATTNVNWLQINTAQQNGSGTVSFTVRQNITRIPRNAIVTIGTHSFSVSQAASNRRSFDFDGDSKSDISLYRPSEGNWYILQSGLGNAPKITNFGFPTDKIVPADYDGDKKADIAVFRNGVWYVMQSQSSTLRVETWGLSTDVPVPADYDGDTKADVAVYRQSESVWYIQRSTDNTLQWRTFGNIGNYPVPADYDGDGKTDLAVYREGVKGSLSTWFILQSSNNVTASRDFGIEGDIAVPADYDGDGRDNITVFRPSDGTWYVSLYPSAGYYTRLWGMTGDIPAAADYDGDGLTDFTVFRQGVWYIMPANGGGTRTEIWGVATDKPAPSAYNSQ